MEKYLGHTGKPLEEDVRGEAILVERWSGYEGQVKGQ